MSFALVDCNSFYASCESLFRPDLLGQPIVVASNNDGCVVARSKEAKALGISMGAPLFKIRDTLNQHQVHVFSSNYALYADVSARVMQTLEELAPRVEIYSIDEAFLDLKGVATAVDPSEFGQQVRETIRHWVGIPVCVGIAPTKTLAKLANRAAKKYSATGGVVDLTNPSRQQRLLAITPVSDVWGIGRQLTAKLKPLGIETALQLANADPKLIRRHFSVVTERTVCELNGVSCLALEEAPPAKQEIVCSRSFGSRITELTQMKQAVSDYAARASEKLRGEQRYARCVTVFLQTSPFSTTPDEPYYANSALGKLPVPSNDTRDVTGLSMGLLQSIWRDGYRYAKAGIMLSDFSAPGVYQTSLFDSAPARPRSQALMSTLDEINKSGLGKVWFAGQGIKKDWAMQRCWLSPNYTTRWSDLPTAS